MNWICFTSKHKPESVLCSRVPLLIQCILLRFDWFRFALLLSKISFGFWLINIHIFDYLDPFRPVPMSLGNWGLIVLFHILLNFIIKYIDLFDHLWLSITVVWYYHKFLFAKDFGYILSGRHFVTSTKHNRNFVPVIGNYVSFQCIWFIKWRQFLFDYLNLAKIRKKSPCLWSLCFLMFCRRIVILLWSLIVMDPKLINHF